MVQITFPDGKEQTFSDDQSAVKDIIGTLSEGLQRQAIGAEFGGKLVDHHQRLDGAGDFHVVMEKDAGGLYLLRHTASHVLAHAVKELYPEAKFAIGPPIENGFYYDFDVDTPFTPEDLMKIEDKMREILKRKPSIHREEWDRAKARKHFEEIGQQYKVELIDDLPDEILSIYVVGDFTDLCAGPHLEDTKRIKNFKVLSAAGAYWRGDSKKPMLQRIYATAFFKKKDLDEYLQRIEEAEKRDHRKLGKSLDLFEVREEAGGGLVFWYPKGAVIREVLEKYLKEENKRRGYQLVVTPHIAKDDLWRTSGHLDYYQENMFLLEGAEQGYVLKPMNCPGHILVFKRKLHSYRDLPVRIAEMGTVYRKELSGTLHGLLRVRGFTQDDAHVFCTPDQIGDEVGAALDFAIDVLTTCGFEDIRVELSVRDPKDPDKYAGQVEEWDMAEAALEAAVQKRELEYTRMEGEAVFYGPKIDVRVVDAIGRLWQLSTVQFDFNLPKRFDITYVASDGDRKQVYMVHRALLGSIERFIGILTEHYAGGFPLWLAPVQCAVLPVSPDFAEYAGEVCDQLVAQGVRAELDARNEKIGRRIREAELQKVPYMLVVGQREVEAKTVSVRTHGAGDLGSKNVEDFVREVLDEDQARR